MVDFIVNSLLGLRQLRHLLHAFPGVIFTGGYVHVCVQVHHIDHVVQSLIFKRILADLAEDFNCEVPSEDTIDNLASLSESLVTIKGVANQITIDLYSGELYNESRYRVMGHAAQIAHAYDQFINGEDFGDFLFSVTKRAVSCANTGLDLLASNIWNVRRWGKLIDRLVMLQFDIDLLLQCPVLL